MMTETSSQQQSAEAGNAEGKVPAVTAGFSQTLGTALGDWVADTQGGLGLGYEHGVLLFGGALGGLELSRYTASAVLAALMVLCVFAFRQRAERVEPVPIERE